MNFSQKFVEVVYNPIFWWPFTSFRPKINEKISNKNIILFIFFYDLSITIISLLVIFAIYLPFADTISAAAYVYWTLVLLTLGVGLLLNTVLYITWALLWNKEIKINN